MRLVVSPLIATQFGKDDQAVMAAISHKIRENFGAIPKSPCWQSEYNDKKGCYIMPVETARGAMMYVKLDEEQSSVVDMTIRELQTQLPWTIRYSTDFRSSPMAHKDFAHTLHHVSKAVGKLHGLADDMDHDRAIADQGGLRGDYGKYVADLVVCSLRLANVFPGGVLDLQRAVEDRIEDKNEVKLQRRPA